MAQSISGRAGYVYLLSNPSMPGMVKIGRTARDPVKRAGELASASGVPTPFRLEGFIRSNDAVRTEAEIHRRLGAARVNRRREFFQVDPTEALRIARAVAAAERARFSAGKTAARKSASLFQLAFVALYANAAFWLWGLDYGELWKPMAANAALALLLPGRFWTMASKVFARHPVLAHTAAVALLAILGTPSAGHNLLNQIKDTLLQNALL